MVTLSFTLLASLAMGVALQQSTVPFLNYLKSLFLLILLLSLLVLDFPFLLILLSHLLFSQSIAHTPSSSFPDFISHFSSLLEYLATSNSELIITGDFNIHVDQPHTNPSSQ